MLAKLILPVMKNFSFKPVDAIDSVDKEGNGSPELILN